MDFKKIKKTKIFMYLLFFLILFYFFYQIYIYIYNPNKLEIALEYTSSDHISASGVFVRDEEIIDFNNKGIINYPYENGAKVHKGSSVAKVYQSEDDAINDNIVRYIDREISVLKESQNLVTSSVTQVNLISKQIEDLHAELLKCIKLNDFKKMYELRENIIILKNKRDLALNKEVNIDLRINTLEKYKSELTSKIKSNASEVYTNQSGFFVNNVDGYESDLNTSRINDITLDNIKNIISDKSNNSQDKIGKVVTNSEIYYVVLVQNNDVSKFKVNSFVNVTFSSQNYSVQMKVNSIRSFEDSNQSLVVLSTDIISKYLVNLRKEQSTISFFSSSGLKVPKKAIRIENGEKYVYVLSGRSFKKKKLDVIYEANDYVLSRYINENSEYLQLFDDIVINGRNIYD